MHALLADFVKQVYARPGRIGQRPMPREDQVDLEGLLYGEENDLPMPEVLAKLVNVSERMFCSLAGISRSQYQRILAGTYDPTVHEIRMIAEAVRRPPTFFIEYRKAMAIAAFINLLEERPGIAGSIYRNYLEVRM
jgi:transcriptional regulator with XRE-family HTH domain